MLEGPAGYFKHIVWVNVLRKQVVPLTHGRFEVVKILGWDKVNDIMYVQKISSIYSYIYNNSKSI